MLNGALAGISIKSRPAEVAADADVIASGSGSACQQLKSELNEKVKRGNRRQPFPVWCVSGINKWCKTPPHNLFITPGFLVVVAVVADWKGFLLRVGDKN